MEDISNIYQRVKPLGESVNWGRIDGVRCDVAYSCGSIIAVFHTVINDSHSQRLAAQSGGENQNSWKFGRKWRFEWNEEVENGLEATRVIQLYCIMQIQIAGKDWNDRFGISLKVLVIK